MDDLASSQETVNGSALTGYFLYERFPKLATLTRKMMEEDFGKTQDQFSRFMTSSAEERYVYLLENNPQLLQRVPQHQLASYLGITPESLSRIKNRLYKK